MSERFRAFSFVDRILPGPDHQCIEGLYAIPSDLAAFPPSLVAEAVGQLAALAAMKTVDFEWRPVAGLAGQIDITGAPRPGQVIKLHAQMESVDGEAVAYNGSAAINGQVILRLKDCVGPMIRVAELDDPQALRERFEVLCGRGVPSGAFRGVPELVFKREGGEKGVSLRATFQVPASAPLFEDHFPRRPVFPGSLLMQAGFEVGGVLAAEIPSPLRGQWQIQSVQKMKLREFIPPGKQLSIEAALKERTGDSAVLMLSFKAREELVGSARVLLGPGS